MYFLLHTVLSHQRWKYNSPVSRSLQVFRCCCFHTIRRPLSLCTHAILLAVQSRGAARKMLLCVTANTKLLKAYFYVHLVIPSTEKSAW